MTDTIKETEQRLLPAPLRGVIVAVALIAVAVGLLAVAHVTGWPAAGPRVASAGGPPKAAAAGTLTPMVLLARLLFAVAVIGAFATLCGALLRGIGQPPVVGEILAGLVLGPSVVGWLAPGVFHTIFLPQVLPYLNLLAQLGLTIFMYTVGSEFRSGLLARQRNAVGAASLALMVVPFALGVLVAIPLYSAFAGSAGGVLTFVAFVGTAMSVTAFPVLARIVRDSGLRDTRIGALALLLAAITDVLAWCALAVVLALAHAQGVGGAVRALVLAVVLAVVLLLGVRPLVRTLTTRYADAELPEPVRLLIVFGLIVGLAAATEFIGVHAIFGGFLAGLVLPKGTPLLGKVADQLGTVNRMLLVPVFFASIGLQTDLGLAVGHPAVLLGGVALLVVAIAGKLLSGIPVGLAGGLPVPQAMTLGVLVNARGITEIVVLTAGLGIGVINEAAFTVMVVMALLTTMMVAPALRIVRWRWPSGAGASLADRSPDHALAGEG
jgi:Kef-type K+ transport system membrane component KefB